MLKIFIIVLIIDITLLTAIPYDRIKKSIPNSRSFFENCQDCIDLPCDIPGDPTCTLKSNHIKGSYYVSFQLSIKTIRLGWVGIVLNSAESPGMVIKKYLTGI